MRKALFAFAIALLTTACGETTGSSQTPADGDTEVTLIAPVPDSNDDEASDAIPPEEVVFVWAESGGCAMAGPNCARYEVTAGGDVSTYREGEAEVAATGSVDPARLAEWIDLVGDMNLDALLGRLGPGETKAAFDGVDFTLSAPQATLDLSSTDVDFAQSEPLFQSAAELATLAAEAAPLELQQR